MWLKAPTAINYLEAKRIGHYDTTFTGPNPASNGALYLDYYVPNEEIRQELKRYTWRANQGMESLLQYTGDILLVGINYDKKSKKHQCAIEKFRI
ncbi:MAG: hypothetical protein ACI4EH_05835 [Oliverpabstia sp.]